MQSGLSSHSSANRRAITIFNPRQDLVGRARPRPSFNNQSGPNFVRGCVEELPTGRQLRSTWGCDPRLR